jgi:hypothetical protein
MGNLCGRDYEADGDSDDENENKTSKELKPLQQKED